MGKQICSCCGQTIKTPKAAIVQTVDTSSMSTDQLYAHYKKTAPVEDARFFLAHCSTLTPEMRAELETLIGRPPARAEFYRRYRAVQDAWRMLRNERERQNRSIVQAA